MNKFSKYLYIIIFTAIIFGAYFIFFKKSTETPVENNSAILENKESRDIIEKEKVLNEEPVTKPKTLPEKILIKVPFTSQAPFANWDEYHEEACEEASIIMLNYYLEGKKLTPEIAEEEIQGMIKFQIDSYGDYKDSNAEEIVRLMEDFYGSACHTADGEKKLKVVYDFKKEEIKEELAKGNPIIVPAAGRLLGNPNFKSPGPLYHNLVLVGYDGDIIITNDPGTKKGEGYRYDLDILYSAIHDFTGKKEDIEKGRKAMIVIIRE